MSVHPHCLACGDEIEVPLAQLGSLRCQECRDDQRALDPALIDPTRRKPLYSFLGRFKSRPKPADGFDPLF